MGKRELVSVLMLWCCRLCVGLLVLPLAADCWAVNETAMPPARESTPSEQVAETGGSKGSVDGVDKEAAKAGKEVRAEGSGAASPLQVGEVTVSGKLESDAAAKIPAVVETVSAEDIEKINAVDTSDLFKYVPNVHVRKLNAGNINRPLAMRGNTSTTAAPRTLVFMDGIRISNYVNGGMSDSPKWQVVLPGEIEAIDVIYGPFSAAYGGNSFGGTVLFSTHFPEKLECHVDSAYTYQNYRAYETDEDLHGYDVNLSVGDKLGPFSFMVWYDRLEDSGQPISFQNVLASTGRTPRGNAVSGWVSDTDPQGKKRYILGSQGVTDTANNTAKVKMAYELTPESEIRFNFVWWDSDSSRDSPETYLRDSAGNPVYAGTVDINGRSYTLSNNLFTYQDVEKQDMLYGLSYTLDSSSGLKIVASTSYYDTFKDLTLVSSSRPTASASGGPGTVTDKDTGSYAADLKAFYEIQCLGVHKVGVGYHFDHDFLDSWVWNASDWKNDERTTLSKRDEGKTLTHGIFLEDTWDINDQWSVYLGGRQEWWSGYDGAKSTDTASGRVTAELEDKNESSFSPKFATTFRPTDQWSLRFSMGFATRYPTVGELFYGGITSSGVINNNNPDLEPEQVFAKDFSIIRSLGSDGEARLTFYQDDVEDAILSQTNSYTNITNYQNVDEVRTRGIELAVNLRRVVIDGLGVNASVGWNDSEILRNDAVPASVGKTFPRVPEWRAKCVLSYAPTDRWLVSFGGSYASRAYANIDNSDEQGGYGGMDDYLVFDTRLSYRILENITAVVGIDNLTDQLYYEFHPYPRRTVFAELKLDF